MAAIIPWLVLAASTAPQVPDSAAFVLRTEVETSADHLFLSDVAECSGAARICEEAYAVDIGPSPAPGKSLFFHQDKIRAMLATEWPGATVALAAGKAVKINAAAQLVGEDVVLEALRAELSKLLAGQERFAATVSKVQVGANFNVRPGPFHVAFPELTAARVSQQDWVYKNLTAHQRMTAQIVREESGEVLLEIPVNAAFELRERLPVPVRSLAAGSIVGPNDLELQWVPVNAGHQQQLTAEEAIVGWRLRRPAAMGQPLTAAQLEMPLAVRKGQMVRLQMLGQGVTVSGQVEAQSNASVGQTIDVMYPATKKKLRAIVTGSATVEYQF